MNCENCIRCCHVLNAGLGEISPSAQRYNLPERKRWVVFVVDTSGRAVWQLSKVRLLTLHRYVAASVFYNNRSAPVLKMENQSVCEKSVIGSNNHIEVNELFTHFGSCF